MTDRLQGAARVKALGELTGWSDVPARDAISKSYRFKNFRQAFAFMTEAALIAEKMDHHPEWSNVYGRVDVTLTTHAAHGLTLLDIQLAKKLDEISSG